MIKQSRSIIPDASAPLPQKGTDITPDYTTPREALYDELSELEARAWFNDHGPELKKAVEDYGNTDKSWERGERPLNTKLDGYPEFVKAGDQIAGKLMRRFDTGATRDTDNDKHDYEAFLCPLVIQRFGEYMHQHRTQGDGTMRSGDNWQKGIPTKEYMKSLWRHMLDLWLHLRSYPGQAREPNFSTVCCAVLFNVQGILHNHLTMHNHLTKKDNI